MTTEPLNPPSEPVAPAVIEPVPTSTPNGDSSPEKPESTSERESRPRGKVARLPKTARDQLNQWLLDGVPYAQIIQRLGELGNDLTIDNISQHKKRAHQVWLTQQAFIDRVRLQQETPHDLATDYDATDVNHAALQLGALHMFEALRDLGPGSLDKKLGGNSTAFFRLIHALARLSRETTQLQKYREACARARAALEPMKDPRRKLTEAERRAIVLHVDEILGLRPEGDAFAQMQQDPELTRTAL